MSSPITKKDIPSPELMSALCCSVSESQQHLLVCDKLEDTSIVSRIPEYEDLFTNDVSKVVGVTSIIKSKQNGFHTVFLGDLGAHSSYIKKPEVRTIRVKKVANFPFLH